MSFLNSLFGEPKKAKTADLEKLAVQFDQAQGKYLKLLIDGLSASEVGERRALAKVIADTVVPALVDNANCPLQPIAKASLLKMLNVLMAELRPPKNEGEKWALSQAAFFTVKRILKIEDDKQRNAYKAEEAWQTRFEAKGFGVTDSSALDKEMAALQADIFPNGPTDAARDVTRVLALFHGKLGENECLECVSGTKALLLISEDKSSDRIIPSIMVRAGNKITEAEAYSAYAYLLGEATYLDRMNKTINTATAGKNLKPEGRKIFEDGMKHSSTVYESAVDADELPNGYGAYGTTISNPVLTVSVWCSTDYLNRLRFNGKAITHDRFGSKHSEVTPGQTDIYQISCDGESLGTIFICPYHKRNSRKAPKGFTFIAGSLGGAASRGLMQSYTCPSCKFHISEADKAWDTASDSGQCPKCSGALRNFPVSVKLEGGKLASQVTVAPISDTRSKTIDKSVDDPKPAITREPVWDRQSNDNSPGTRVQATTSELPKTISPPQPTADPIAPVSTSAEPNQNSSDAQEDRLYEQIAQELETNTVDKGLWTKVFAQAGGDERQTRVLYIQARFARLLAIENTQRDAIRRKQEYDQEEAARLARVRSIRANQQSRIEQIETAGKSVELKSLAASHTGSNFLYLCGLGKWFVSDVQGALEANPFVLDHTTLDEGYTGLHIAVLSKDKKMIEYLVEQGANIQARDSQGKTPLDMARETNQPEVVELLERFRAE